MDRLQRHIRLHSLDPESQKKARDSKPGKLYLTSKLSLAILLVLLVIPFRMPAGQPVQSSAPTVFVWSNTYGTSNITDPTRTSGTLRIELNITNAPPFSAFDARVYYDWRFITAQSVDATTGTVLGPNPPFVHIGLDVQGEVQIAVAAAEPYQGEKGTLAHIDFTITTPGITPLALGPTSIAATDPITSQSYEVLPETRNGFFNNIDVAKQGPVALFTYSPQTIVQGDPITFNASTSLDPDNLAPPDQGINTYAWRFGDRYSLQTTNPLTVYTYSSFAGALYGTFYVVLTVTDQDSYIGITVQRIAVQQRQRHDVEIFSITAQPTSVRLGTDILIIVQVRNLGTTGEVFNMTVKYGPPDSILDSLVSESIEAGKTLDKQFTLKTSSLAASTYLVRASVAISGDEETSNNEKSAIVRVTEPSDGFLGLGNPYLLLPIVAVGGGLLVIWIVRRSRPCADQE